MSFELFYQPSSKLPVAYLFSVSFTYNFLMLVTYMMIAYHRYDALSTETFDPFYTRLINFYLDLIHR